MSDAPVLLLASGLRCGSTLLQRLLNSHPRLLVWGEQDGFLDRFMAEHRRLLTWQHDYRFQFPEYLERGYDTFSANMLPPAEELTAAAVGYLRGLFADPAARLGKPRWGLKEVRCDAAVAAFVRELFPEARIVHLTRDPVACLLSLKEWEESPELWSRADTEANFADWARINASFLPDASPPPPPHLALRYEDLVAHPTATLARLCAFADLDPADLDPTNFDRRLHREGDEGRRPRPRPLATRDSLPPADRALLHRPPLPAIAAAYGYPLPFA